MFLEYMFLWEMNTRGEYRMMQVLSSAAPDFRHLGRMSPLFQWQRERRLWEETWSSNLCFKTASFNTYNAEKHFTCIQDKAEIGLQHAGSHGLSATMEVL